MDSTVQKGVPVEEMIRRVRRGHRRTRLAPKYRARYGEAKENNIGVFQGSSISALLFIIYLDDMMGDLAALSRRTKLPMGIIQGRPHEQNKKYYGGKSKEKKEKHMEKYKKHAPSEMPLTICCKKQKTEINEHREEKGKKLEEAGQQTRKGDQAEKQRDTETEIGEGNIEEPDQRKNKLLGESGKSRRTNSNRGDFGKRKQKRKRRHFTQERKNKHKKKKRTK